jgi:hypothetical protein
MVKRINVYQFNNTPTPRFPTFYSLICSRMVSNSSSLFMKQLERVSSNIFFDFDLSISHGHEKAYFHIIS